MTRGAHKKVPILLLPLNANPNPNICLTYRSRNPKTFYEQIKPSTVFLYREQILHILPRNPVLCIFSKTIIPRHRQRSRTLPLATPPRLHRRRYRRLHHPRPTQHLPIPTNRLHKNPPHKFLRPKPRLEPTLLPSPDPHKRPFHHPIVPPINPPPRHLRRPIPTHIHRHPPPAPPRIRIHVRARRRTTYPWRLERAIAPDQTIRVAELGVEHRPPVGGSMLRYIPRGTPANKAVSVGEEDERAEHGC